MKKGFYWLAFFTIAILNTACRSEPPHPQTAPQPKTHNPSGKETKKGLLKEAHQKLQIDARMKKINQKFPGTRAPSLDNFVEIIGGFTFPLAKVERGVVPYYVTGDFDCDKKPDDAIMTVTQEAQTLSFLLSREGARQLKIAGESIHLTQSGRYPVSLKNLDDEKSKKIEGHAQPFVRVACSAVTLSQAKQAYLIVWNPNTKAFEEYPTRSK